MSDLVSVIVPVYNHERYVEECLTSIFAQSYSPIEVIVVDDGSTDGSVGVIERVIGDRDDCLLVEQENKGSHSAINRGIKLSSGRYVTIVNSDDYIGEHRIERFVKATEDSGARLLFSKVCCVDGYGKDISGINDYAKRLVMEQEGASRCVSVGFALVPFNVAISTGNLFMTRELYDLVGGFREFRLCHDWDFVLRALLQTEPVYIDEVSYYYRIHPDNSYASLWGVADDEGLRVIREFFREVRFHRVSNPLAPTPMNWPHYFEHFMDKTDLWWAYRGT